MATRARDLMQSPVVVIGQDASLLDAHRILVEEEIHGAPVVDDDGVVVGVISSLDLLRVAEEEQESPRGDAIYYRDVLPYAGPPGSAGGDDFQDRLSSRRVAEAMSTCVVSVPPDATAAQVARTLRENGIHRVLVAEKDALLGIVTAFDLMRLLEGSDR